MTNCIHKPASNQIQNEIEDKQDNTKACQNSEMSHQNEQSND